MSLLNSHPNVKADGEIFKWPGGKSCEEIWSDFFINYPKRIKFAGFKLFYNHPRTGDKKVWEFIEEDPNIIIIHLTRNNLLRSLVSKKIGLKTKQWTESLKRPSFIPVDIKKIHLDTKECEEYFKKIKDYEKTTNKRFQDHQIIPVTYEELAENKQQTISRIFRDLELQDFSVVSGMKRQNPETLSELVVNYEELNAYFNNTRWTNFFTENKL